MKPWRTVATASMALSITAAAFAQRFDPRTPQTLVVGPPPGPSPTLRGDALRRGRARHVPKSPRIAWRKEVGQSTPLAPLVDDQGSLSIVTGKSEVISIDREGNETARLRIGGEAPSSASLLSDGALLVASVARELILLRAGNVVYSQRIGRDHPPHESERTFVTSVLALDDGGAVLAFDDDLLSVDRDGHLRARATLPAPIRGALIAGTDGAVVAVLSTGTVAAWKPGGEVRRLGRLSAPAAPGSVSARVGSSILAVLESTALARFDLARSATTIMLSPPGGSRLGVPSVGEHSLAFLAWNGGRTNVVELDEAGRELRSVQVSVFPSAADAGASSAAPLSDVLMDDEGRVAFVTPEGVVGTLDRGGTVRTLGETVCPKGRAAAGVSPPVGLVASDRGFVVACDNGLVLSIQDEQP